MNNITDFGKFWEESIDEDRYKIYDEELLRIKKYLQRRGYSIIHSDHEHLFSFSKQDIYDEVRCLGNDFIAHWNSANTYTLGTEEKIRDVIEAVRYVTVNNISGAFVECGIYSGGIATLMATLALRFDSMRDLYFYDTFEGMTMYNKDKDEKESTLKNRPVLKPAFEVGGLAKSEHILINGLKNLSYPENKYNIIKGDVLKTLNDEKNLPEKIAILRLDTDLYDSTKKELEVLFPRLVKGGVLILDDYMSFPGQKKAVDEYFDKINFKPFFARGDFESRVIIKN